MIRTPDPHPHRPDEIVVESLHKSFGDNHVLRGVSLVVNRGEMIAIVGGSGCGKTVLLKHMIGHLRPDAGRILLADHETPESPLRDLASMTDHELDRIRIHWAVVFQRNALLTGTVFENLALWPREIKRMSDAQIMPLSREALGAVGLDPDDVMKLDRESLSGGMAKRVAIARALVMNPWLVFYDEPTAGLDPEHGSQIHELIGMTHDRVPAPGAVRTTVIITHDTELLRRLRPRIVMLHDGVVFFDGEYDLFRESDAPPIRPYFDQMPTLHRREYR